MKNQLTIVGSGTCNLLASKAAASALIEKGSLRLVFDFGRGVAVRLTELGLKQDDVEHIFISHFHADHVTDLWPYLHAALHSRVDPRTKDLNIYGPKGTKAFVAKMFSVFGWEERGRSFTVTVHDITDGRLTVAGEDFQVRDLRHSHGLRLGNIAVAGDASLNDALIDLLTDTELAIFDSGHLSDDEICRLAVKTQAQKLVCSHQYRHLDEAKLNKQAQSQGYRGLIIVANDLMEFEF